MINRLLFGFRYARTTLVGGGLWLVCGWAAIGERIGPRSELPSPVRSVADLVDSAGPLGVASAAAIGAYIAGVTFELLLAPVTGWLSSLVDNHLGRKLPGLERRKRAIDAQLAGAVANYTTAVKVMVVSFGKPDEVLLSRTADVYEIEGTRLQPGLTARRKLADGISPDVALERVIGEAVTAAMSMSHVSNIVPRDEPELAVTVEQLEDEARLRETIGWPLIALGIVVTASGLSAWWTLGAGLIVVGFLLLLFDAPRHRLHLSERVATALRLERIRPPALTTLIKLIDLDKTELHEREERSRRQASGS